MTQDPPKARRHNQPWSDQEIEAAVAAYVEMFRRQARGEDIQRNETIEDLLVTGLKDRNRKSAEFRFCNISSVHMGLAGTHLAGFSPLDHVAPKHRKLIARLLVQYGFVD